MTTHQRLLELIRNTNPRWIGRKIKVDTELLEYVNTFYGNKVDEKAYNAVHGNPEPCKYGNYRTFKNFEQGYQHGCGHPSKCKCAHELGIENQKKTFAERLPEQQAAIDKKKQKTYTKNKEAGQHFKRNNNINIVPGEEKQLITKLLENITTERYERTLNCYPELISFLKEHTKQYNPNSLIEQLYIVLVQPPNKTPCGKYPSFKSFTTGYNLFCGPSNKCDCAKLHQATVMREHYEQLSDQDKLKYQNNRITGMLNKHGHANPMHVPEIKQKYEQNNINKTGVPYPLLSKQVREQTKVTHRKKNGTDYPFQSPATQKKATNTTIERYGGLMTHARKGAYKKYNGNPFQHEAVKRSIQETNIKRYGVKHHRQNPDKLLEFVQSMQSKYQVSWPSQLHIDQQTFAILENKEQFSNLCENHSLNELSDMLKVRHELIKARHDFYNLNFYKTRSRSRYEDEIAHWLGFIGVSYKHDKKMPNGKTVDFLIENKIAIEFNGLFAHSQYSLYGKLLGIDQYYHYNKYKECKDNGIQLFTIFEDEWNDKKDIIKNRLRIALNNAKSGDAARKLSIKSINNEESAAFLDQYHLQGRATATCYYGAFDKNNNLVGVMTFILRNSNENEWELNRFVTDPLLHPGLFSKMLSYFEKDQKPNNVYSFSDNRWSYGNVYEKNGFTCNSYVKPDYYVTDYTVREHKFNWRKSRIKARFNISIENKTELELTRELNWDRIWDCGKIKWVKSYSDKY